MTTSLFKISAVRLYTKFPTNVCLFMFLTIDSHLVQCVFLVFNNEKKGNCSVKGLQHETDKQDRQTDSIRINKSIRKNRRANQ